MNTFLKIVAGFWAAIGVGYGGLYALYGLLLQNTATPWYDGLTTALFVHVVPSVSLGVVADKLWPTKAKAL